MFIYKFKILTLFLFFFAIFYNVSANVVELPLLNKIIYLDTGHGGVDPGAYYKNIYEEDINLEITLKLRNILESKGAIVYLIRDGDYDLSNPKSSLRKRSDLSNRANAINNSDADIYLSIHLNSSTSTSWRGAQAFYDDINVKNKEIAETFQKYFNKYLNSNRKAKEINDLYMYKRINIPGLLLEVGFISNPNERYILRQNWYQEKIANVITNCLVELLT